jgi:hypothetical protein
VIEPDEHEIVCPNYGSQEEIIAGKSPLGRRCRTAMVKATRSSKGLTMTPKFVIDRMQKTVQK